MKNRGNKILELLTKDNKIEGPEAKFETLRDCTWEQLEEVRSEVGEEDYSRAHFVLGEMLDDLIFIF